MSTNYGLFELQTSGLILPRTSHGKFVSGLASLDLVSFPSVALRDSAQATLRSAATTQSTARTKFEKDKLPGKWTMVSYLDWLYRLLVLQAVILAV